MAKEKIYLGDSVWIELKGPFDNLIIEAEAGVVKSQIIIDSNSVPFLIEYLNNKPSTQVSIEKNTSGEFTDKTSHALCSFRISDGGVPGGITFNGEFYPVISKDLLVWVEKVREHLKYFAPMHTQIGPRSLLCELEQLIPEKKET